MRVSGWWRLAIVLALLWGIFVAFIAYDARPRAENVRNAWVTDGLNLMASRIATQEGISVAPWDVARKLDKSTPEDTIAFFEEVERDPSENQQVFVRDLALINKRHRTRLAEIDQGWPSYIAHAFAAWLVPLLVVFGLIAVIRWVVQGFKAQGES